jgi:protein TonB
MNCLDTRFFKILRSSCLLLCLVPALISVSRAQQEQPESGRKMVTKAVPVYPALAQRMSLGGTVKVQALVFPNGTMKSAEILGGHPVLAQAAIEALRKCKWDPAAHETTEIVIFNFHPQ